MRDFFRSPLFRCLVCLVLVCCILVHVSPIRAKAFAGLTSSALIYLLYAAAVGAVIIPPSIEVVNAIGKKVDEKIRVSVAPELLDAWNNVTQRYDNWVPEWDPGEWHDDLKHALAGGLLTAIGSMMVDLVVQGAINVVGDEASTGYSFYNEWLLPDIPSSANLEARPYISIGCVVNDDGSLTGGLFLSDVPFEGCWDSTDAFIGNLSAGVTNYTFYPLRRDFNLAYFWGASSNGYVTKNQKTATYGLVYTNYDLIGDSSREVIFSASPPPSKTLTIPIEPDIYVGDLPDQIRDGEKDEENLNLPIIDPFKIISDPNTGFEDVTKTLQDLKDGVITYDQYIDKVTVDEPIIDPDPSGPTDPTDPTDDPEAIPEDMAPYIFDLRKIFPFCIPFDLYDFLTCLDATPVAPVINWQIQLPGGGTYPLTIDLSAFDSVAQLLRRLELLVFCIALGIKTRDLIKG